MADLFQHVIIQFDNTAFPFQLGNKLHGGYQFSVPLPSDQGLRAADCLILNVDLRLIIHLKFSFFQRRHKVCDNALVLHHGLLDVVGKFHGNTRTL